MIMLAVDDRVLLSGSEPECRPGVRSVGAPDPNERLHIAILLFPRGAMGERRAEPLTLTSSVRTETRQSGFEFVRGADLGHVSQVLEFALEYGLTVVETSVSRRRVLLSGPVGAINRAFGTTVAVYEYPGGRYRARTGPLHVPARLASIVQSVTGI
jgi:kumamolisin